MRSVRNSPFAYGTLLTIARGAPILVLIVANFRLTDNEFGAVALYVTAVATGSLIADAGVDSAATWLLSRATSADDERRYFAALNTFRVALALVVTFALCIVQMGQLPGDGAVSVILVVAACAGNILTARNGAQRVRLRILGRGEPRSLLTEKLIAAFVFALGAWLLPAEPSITGLAYIAGTVLGALAVSSRPSFGEWRATERSGVVLLRVALPFIATTLSSAAVWRFPIVWLGVNGDVASAGYLALAIYPIQMVSSVPVLTSPLLLVKDGKYDRDHGQIIGKAAIMGSVAAVLLGAVGVTSYFLIPQTWVDPEVFVSLAWLSGALLSLWVNPLTVATIRVRDGAWVPTWANAGGAVVGVCLAISLSGPLGATGAAVSILGAEVLATIVLLALLLLRKTGAN
jgi:O-antigen/teichoic acid export membrane protein